MAGNEKLPTVPGMRRLDEGQRVKHMTSPLPLIEASILTVAARQADDELGRRIAAALADLAEELHHWR